MKTITLDSTISLRDDVEIIRVDDATIVTDAAAGDFYGMELIAGRIWELLPRGGNVAALCDTLMNEYHVDRETCERDVLEFLNDAMSQGLIRAWNKETGKAE